MNVVNIINFVRGCEPRWKMDLVTPVREELKLCKKFGFKNTMLLQYDAMLNNEIMDAVKEEATDLTEFGVWFENCRQLLEKVGLKWNSREGYDWDWYIDPGFLPAYEKQDREKLIDEVMRFFKENFGYYPKSVGSWMIDPYSMQYMSEKYDVQGFAICREQFGVDAYTLEGGYFNQGYYPSKYNSICPASTKENQINSPVFRLLGPDPFYNYGDRKEYPNVHNRKSCLPTFEPVWYMGSHEDTIDWFYDTYFNNESLAFSYIQVGQENSFGWDDEELAKVLGSKGYGQALIMQFEKLKPYVDADKCTIMTMAETSKWYKDNFDKTAATCMVAKKDIVNDYYKDTVWYDCINYRFNVLSSNGKLFIRDIYKFDETFKNAYLDSACHENTLYYENLPVMDGYIWRRDGILDNGIFFEGEYEDMTVEKDGNGLILTCKFADRVDIINLTETEITINTTKPLTFKIDDDAPITFEKDSLSYNHHGQRYKIAVDGILSNGHIEPKDNKIVIKMV